MLASGAPSKVQDYTNHEAESASEVRGEVQRRMVCTGEIDYCGGMLMTVKLGMCT